MSFENILRVCSKPKRAARLVNHLLVLSLVASPLACGSDGGGGPNPVAGAAGTLTGVAGTPGSNAGGSAGTGQPVGTAGSLQTSGGSAPTASGGTTTSGGSSGSPGTGGGAGGASGGGPSSGGTGAAGGGGGAGGQAPIGGAGASSGGVSAGAGGSAGAPTQANPLAHLATSAREVGLLLANRFSRQSLAFSSVGNLPGDGYKTACEWYGSLGVAKLTSTQALLDSLVMKFNPLKANFVSAMTGGDAHVDRYIFGMVPLEIYLQIGDASYLPLGTEVADRQQTTNQTRNAIDDMFMMTGLQLQAYRATKTPKYIDFMAKTMVDYLGAQRTNGLFFHNVNEAPVHWGRGNGWFAAGMAEMMRDLPTSSMHYATIEAGYKKMMDGLIEVQGENGLWYQVLDMPDNASNWEESSGSAMFTYAMIAGVRRGVLDAKTYVPVIEAAWAGLRTKISAQGDVSNICVGTWYKSTAQEYMALTRLTGDGHGQAPVLWAAAELLR